ncbi:site-specific DNA-methyltransferase [Halovibrio sp. HP20-50]|uniref:site-specific DNA-methyltransferase n=1 Tax=Halovibrio sp. HP20-59 TaxID=3080275 RepID=UPI00294AB64A|nr:site-specific DNA-methyltransferase [Halovibrio sp. HP20-59]MEA2117157.1 site-specific DNA-methyltransferase [Halovibrio sp. HP20-59]
MNEVNNQKFQELVAKLREIFQIDQPELDFGIYRILNARADEINEYLEKRLPKKVQAALSSGSDAQCEQITRELKEKEGQYTADGLDPDNVPKVQELRQKLAEYSAGASEHENAVFSHLLTFFSRYYDNGDFISQRRYKGDTYAIPYSGEEVMLHWANKDQYYTKSGENFANYSFKLDDGRTVHFRLVSADTAKDNRKDNDKERRFALIHPKTVIRTDEQGEEYEEALNPVEEVVGAEGTELTIRFEYAPQPKGTKQDALVKQAVDGVLNDDVVKARWLDLGNRAPTEKNPQRTQLEKYLTDYTTKNNADYFIHKNLGGFLRRELDFYIKNEVMHLDDVQNAGAFADIEKNLRMIQCLRTIALELIGFLAQLEDFQKKLWLKKKFVVSSHYCITLDRVFAIGEDIEDEEEKAKAIVTRDWLLSEIAANEKQWGQWQQLGIWDGVIPGTVEDLKARTYQMVDTSLFDDLFSAKLLSHLPCLDESTSGLLLNGDNFQGLRLLSERYRSSVTDVYIDPPYNTDAAPIIYKNGFKDSTWLSLISNRFDACRFLELDTTITCITIDDVEMHRLQVMLEELRQPALGVIAIKNNPAGRTGTVGFSTCHEYAMFFGDPEKSRVGRLEHSDAQKARYKESDEDGAFEWTNFRKHGGGNTYRTERPRQYYPIYIKGEKLRLPDMEWNQSRRDWDVLEKPDDAEITIYPIDDKGRQRIWDFGAETAKNNLKHLKVKPDSKGEPAVYRKWRINSEGLLPQTIWDTSKMSAAAYGTNLLADFFGETHRFSFPKSVYAVMDCLRTTGAAREKQRLILDYFAGSGTTGHAAIELNRKDGGSRNYILVEQGDYFETVMKPRLQKIIFSTAWKNGKPTAPETGISHCFKVLKLESYEDTLNNLQLRREVKQNQTLDALDQAAKDDYLLHYMLGVESRGSLLSVEDFNKPFDYAMNIATDSAGAYERTKVDLVETFNYLIGLSVKHIDAQPERGFVTVTGTSPSGESCLVLWRDCELLDYEGVRRLCDRLAINPADNEFDVVYINGDHNIPTVLTQTAEEGGATRVLKLRQIEPVFLDRMFTTEDV